MCDENDIRKGIAMAPTRRQFGAIGAMGALAACTRTGSGHNTPASGSGGADKEIQHETVRFPTSDGTLDGEFFYRRNTRNPGIIFWPDIAGIRPANRHMAQRLAKVGYAVLLANPYYRDVHGQQFADFADFAGQGGFEKVRPWRERFAAHSVMKDAAAAADWLDRQASVDPGRGLGTQGYCMTGGFALWGAGGLPRRIGAAASFHGAGLVQTDNPQGPQTMFAKNTGAHYLICIARNDDAKSPGDKDVLRKAAKAAGATAEIEVYPADHGWCVPDSPSYDEPQAEAAWKRLLAIYSASL